MNEKVEEVNRRLKEMGAPYTIEYTKIHKNNVVLDAIRLCGHTNNAQPIVYINKEEFLSTDNSEVIKNLDETFEYYSLDVDTDLLCNREFIFEHVYPRLVSKANLSWIKSEGVVYTKFLDMAVLYYVVISDEASQMQSFLLNEAHIPGVEICDLHRRALSNLKHNAQVIPFSELLYNISPETPFDGPNMWIVTNHWRINGAAVMLLPDLMNDISDMFDEDFIILPSSVHEIIVVPIGLAQDLNIMLDMVCEINESTVRPEERLTNNVYIWDGQVRPYKK